MDNIFDDDLPEELHGDTKRLHLSLNDLCGLHEDTAKRIGEINGFDVRITRRNGRQSAKLTDSRMDRIIMHVDYCVVVRAIIG